MSDPANFHDLINRTVAAKMTPEFIEKEIETRVEKLVIESIDRALRSYSDTGKLIEAAVTEALKVDRLDLPTYGTVVASMLKAQIEARVSEVVAGRLAADMDELLHLAPKTIKLSEIAAKMLNQADQSDWGPAITVIVEPTEYGSTWLYLDEDHVYTDFDKRRATCNLLISKDGTIASASFNDRDIKTTKHVGRAYGLEQRIRAFYACGTVIELDADHVVTTVGDY